MSNLKSEEMVFCFVILHFGDVGITNDCLRSICSLHRPGQVSLVIVDNELAKDEESRVDELDFETGDLPFKLVRIYEDGGFSYANNVGYLVAKNDFGANTIIICNNDITFTDEKLLDKLCIRADQGFDVIGPAVIHAGSGKHQNPLDLEERSIADLNKTIILNRIGLFLFPFVYPILYWFECRRKNRWLNSSEENVELDETGAALNIVLFGACLIFMPRFVKNETKAFSPETHFYYEEYILYHRCMSDGYTTAFCPEMSCLHESGKSTASSFSNRKKKMRFEMSQIASACAVYKKMLISI